MSLPRWLSALAVAPFALLLLAAGLAYRAPAPAPADAPADRFSARRAQEILARLLGDETPHPIGTAANEAVRARIVAELDGLGLSPHVQTALVASRGTVARVHNVLARIGGRMPGPAVLLAAHHDSVAAGPGASDDGVAVAAMIETARALLAGPPLDRSVILLIDDGEEFGLFGARAFCGQHLWAKEVGTVLNFEARGTCGPSLLFETAGGDHDLMRHAAAALARPMTGSAFAAVYRTMPNDTDLTVFGAHGMAGLNFAFIGGARRYHTPLDDLAHVDPGSVQHHGDNMLALARSLATGTPPAVEPHRRALFFDLLGRAVIVLPDDVERMVGAALVVAFAVCCLLKRRSGTLSFGRLFAGLAVAPVGLVAAALLGQAAAAGFAGIERMPTPFPPQPIVPAAGYALAGVAAVLASATIFVRWADAWHLFAATGGFLVLLGAALSFALPGAGYPLLLPAAVMVAGMLCTRRAGTALAVFHALAGAAAALMLAPFFVFLTPAVGLGSGGIHAMLAALAAATLVPAVPALGGRLLPAAGISALAAALSVPLALFWPAHDAHHPARANLVHCTVAGQQPCWIFDGAAAFAEVGPTQLRRPLPWEPPGSSRSAPSLGLPMPELTVDDRQRERNGQTTVRGTMRSPRGAPWLSLWLPPGLELVQASIADIALEPRRIGAIAGGWRYLAFVGAEPGEAIPFAVTTRGASPQRVHLVDRSPGLPAAARPFVDVRARAAAAPIHLGDGVVAAVPLLRW